MSGTGSSAKPRREGCEQNGDHEKAAEHKVETLPCRPGDSCVQPSSGARQDKGLPEVKRAAEKRGTSLIYRDTDGSIHTNHSQGSLGGEGEPRAELVGWLCCSVTRGLMEKS